MITEVIPEGETVRVGGHPLTYVRRADGLLHTFVFDKIDGGQARVRVAVQPMASSSERLTISQTFLLGPEQLGELATEALSLKSQLDAESLVPDPPTPSDTGS